MFNKSHLQPSASYFNIFLLLLPTLPLFKKNILFIRSIESDKRWREVQVLGLNYRPRSPRWNEGDEKEEKETQEMDQEEKIEAKKKEKEKMKVNGAKNIYFRLAEEDEFNQTKRLEHILSFSSRLLQ